MAGATLGAPPARFAWQVQHLEHPKARFAWQVQHLEHLHRGPRKSGDNGLLWAPLRFCVAGAALGTLQARLAWRAQHLEHLRRIWRGRCSTWSTFIEVRGSPATSDYFGRRLVLRGRCSTWSTSGLFGVAGAALGAPQACFALAGQHWKHLSCVLRGMFLQRSNHLHSIITTTPATQHHLQHHLHNIINTTPSTHIITYWQVQHLEHCHVTPSASFLLIPLLLFFVVASSLFCFR